MAKKSSKHIAICEHCHAFVTKRSANEARDWCFQHHETKCSQAQCYYLTTADVIQAIHTRFGGILGL